MFQFHTGSIKRWVRFLVGSSLERFNSILVRLKVKLMGTENGENIWFQFHTGSIKSDYVPSITGLANAMFQFHTGSIKSGVSPFQ